MQYASLIQKLFSINFHAGMKLGLESMKKLQELCDFPDRHFKTIHVAGTNGKGSVSTKIAASLQQEGYKVGLFTSPHLSSFRERIRLNGEMIPESFVEKILAQIFELLDHSQLTATFFEITTLLALLYFSEKQAQFVVLETGLGGRLDATNIIHPILSVITSISFDHVEQLGNTLEKIALEKAGIIKPLVPVVIGPNVPWSPIQTVASALQSPLFQVLGSFENYHEENKAIAKRALNLLSNQITISKRSIEKGIEANQPCRLELLEGDPLVVLDVAHNVDGLQHLFSALKQKFPLRRFTILFGLSQTKDVTGCLKEILHNGSFFHLIEAPNGRGVPVKNLFEAMKSETPHLFLHASIEEAVRCAQSETQKRNEILVICGSCFIMSEARRALGFKDSIDEVDLNERRTV